MDTNTNAMPQMGPLDQIGIFLEKNPVIYQFLRFACIGLLNTALDFLVLNSVSKAMGISQGWQLGVIDFFSFCLAMVQSYLWNRTWTFGNEQGVTLVKNIVRLFWVGLLGALAIILVLVGSKGSAPASYYAILLVVYLIAESVVWRGFGFHLADWHHEGHSMLTFAIVTFIGLAINVLLVSVLSVHVHLVSGADLNKNIAKVLATGVSLFWNFIGYKLVVFKK